MLIVLPVFLALRKTRWWVPWLLVASYFFYGWWNPYYLILVLYSTTLDYVLVALMDHCPLDGRKVDLWAHLTRLRFEDRVMRNAFIVCALATLALLGLAVAGPPTLRPTMAMLSIIVALMAVGAFFSRRLTWLVISIINNLALLLFFKYARFVIENLNGVLAWLHIPGSLPDPSTLMPFGFGVRAAGRHLLLHLPVDELHHRLLLREHFTASATSSASPPSSASSPNSWPGRSSGPSISCRSSTNSRVIRMQNVTDGLSLFLVGLFKKLALANYLSFYVERVYDNPAAFGAPALILARSPLPGRSSSTSAVTPTWRAAWPN